jgi:hypothetical protein
MAYQCFTGTRVPVQALVVDFLEPERALALKNEFHLGDARQGCETIPLTLENLVAFVAAPELVIAVSLRDS